MESPKRFALLGASSLHNQDRDFKILGNQHLPMDWVITNELERYSTYLGCGLQRRVFLYLAFNAGHMTAEGMHSCICLASATVMAVFCPEHGSDVDLETSSHRMRAATCQFILYVQWHLKEIDRSQHTKRLFKEKH